MLWFVQVKTTVVALALALSFLGTSSAANATSDESTAASIPTIAPLASDPSLPQASTTGSPAVPLQTAKMSSGSSITIPDKQRRVREKVAQDGALGQHAELLQSTGSE